MAAAWVLLIRPQGDYMAGASGLVVTSEGSPLGGVRVSFKPADVVYKVIEPIRSAEVTSDDLGRFRFSFISCGHPARSYRLTFQKDGFETLVVRGYGVGKHRVVMKRVSASAAVGANPVIDPESVAGAA